MYQSPKLPKYRGSQIAISNAKKPVVKANVIKSRTKSLAGFAGNRRH
jgi:hypothetical protein